MIMAMLRVSNTPQKVHQKRKNCAQWRIQRHATAHVAPWLYSTGSLLEIDEWMSLVHSLCEAAAQTMGYSRRKHQDRFEKKLRKPH